MIKTLLKAINKAENLYQLYYYKGYINALRDDEILKEQDYKILTHTLDLRINTLLLFEE